VIPITDKVLEGFARALQTEIDLRDQLFKELEAKEAAETKYTACKQQAAASPEFTQILMRLADTPENASTEEMMKRMAQMSQDQEALVVKMCGPAPVAVNTAQRLLEIQQKAAAAAGPIR
jgi:hypothetical protein